VAKQPSAIPTFGLFAYSGASVVPLRAYGGAGLAGSASTAWEIIQGAPRFRGSYGLNQWLFKGFHQYSLISPAVRRSGLDVLSLRGRAGIPVLLDAVSPGSAPTGAGTDGPKGCDGSTTNPMANFVTNRHGDVTKAGGVSPEKWPAWMRGFTDY